MIVFLLVAYSSPAGQGDKFIVLVIPGLVDFQAFRVNRGRRLPQGVLFKLMRDRNLHEARPDLPPFYMCA